jgi:molybdopterin/thiamine biosynthesis adenylyltransferase
MNQFVENFGILSQETFDRLKEANVMIVGLGGLGGHLANTLTRLGVNHLFLVDFDTFSMSNLNRQLFSNQKNIGKSKVMTIKEELIHIQPNLKVVIYNEHVEQLDQSITEQIDFIFDAVDNIKTKLYLETLATKHAIPLFHGAIGGYYGQVGIVMPGSHLLSSIYQNQEKGIEKELKSPSFTPAIIANMMAMEFIKFLSNKEKALINQLMMIDLFNHAYEIMLKKE